MNEIEKYISLFNEHLQTRLFQIRDIILECAPDADEHMAYGMPAYKTFNKPLVYFAGFKNHVGLYALPSGHAHFSAEFAKYKQGKGSVQFPNEEPLPLELIKKIVQFRVTENENLNLLKSNSK